MTDRTVSVILHVWNGAAHLSELLDSVLGQTHRQIELCVLDDGSSDATPDLLAAAAAADQRVVLQRQEHRGRGRLHETFMAAVAMASHDLIAIANADDVWLPHKLARQVEVLDRHPEVDVCWHDATLIDASGGWVGPSLRAPWLRVGPLALRDAPGWAAVTRPCVSNPTVLFRRRLLDLVGPQTGGWVHDSRWWLRASLLGASYLGLPERLLRYRVHAGGHSTATVRQPRMIAAYDAAVADLLDSYPVTAFHPELPGARWTEEDEAWASAHLAWRAARRGLREQAARLQARADALRPGALASSPRLARLVLASPWWGPAVAPGDRAGGPGQRAPRRWESSVATSASKSCSAPSG